MIARLPNPERLETIYRKIEEYPGRRPAWFARRLGLHRSEVIRALPALEEKGFLLIEDERGGLWPFRRGK